MVFLLPGLVLECIGVLLLAAGVVTGSIPAAVGGICLIACTIGVPIFRVATS